ncbi:MAG: YdbL family protein [Rhodovibrionaceae bacterium]|nr:YdbL family protein [Rhodovibrionaceae bacterium]
MFRRSFLVAALGLTAFAASLLTAPGGPAQAASLDELRAAGVIAERFDGLLEIRQGGNAEARQIVQQVNAERTKIYQKRANEQGVSVDQVGRVYAKQILQKAPAGTYFKQENGSYVQK